MVAEGTTRPLRVLAVAAYYRPYLSGLTVYLQRVAEALVRAGHQVTVLTSRYPRGSPPEEVLGGVQVVRVPVWFSLGKGVVTPTLPLALKRYHRFADVVWLHLPHPDAGLLSWVAKGRLKKPLAVTYHCDVTLGPKLRDRAAQAILRLSHRWCLDLADLVVAQTGAYAASSPLLSRVIPRVTVIPPPVPLLQPGPGGPAALRKRLGLQPTDPVVGWVGRVSREKGLHVLAQAMPEVWKVYPGARVVCVGPRQEVAGEGAYLREVERLVRPFGERWLFAGVLSDPELAAFYALCSLLVFPSVNRTEAFGMVQVEAMRCGTPVVASDLPGVREPVQLTGMGRLVPPEDPTALAQGVLAVLHDRAGFAARGNDLLSRFDPETVASRYLALFTRLSRSPLGRVRGPH